VELKIKNPGLFVSAETGEVLGNPVIAESSSFPRQLPKGVVEEEVVSDA